MPQLTVTVTIGRPDRVVIAGDIDLATVAQIDAALAPLTGNVLVDCAAVGFIDSAGFHALDRGHEAVIQRGATFAVAGLNDFATRLADLLALPYLTEPTARHHNPRILRRGQLVSS